MVGELAHLWLCAAVCGVAGIPPGIVHDLRTPVRKATYFTPFQSQTLAAINRYRTLLDLPPMQLDPNLCSAAQAHSRYLTVNKCFTHDEEPGRPGFTGTMPWDRVRTAGYTSRCSEGLSSATDPAVAVAQLMAAPYHRIPILEPVQIAVGVGRDHAGSTIEFSSKPGAAGVVVYPADGQGGVATKWQAREEPDPLRMHASNQPVGYVISYHAFLADGVKAKFGQATLTADDGKSVECFVNTPGTDDHLENALLLIPTHPLQPGTHYTATVEASAGEGADISRTWGFMTAVASPGSSMTLRVQARPGGRGSLLKMQIANRGAAPSGRLILSISVPGKPEMRGRLPVLSSGDVFEVEVSARGGKGVVRLVDRQRKMVTGSPFDIRRSSR